MSHRTQRPQDVGPAAPPRVERAGGQNQGPGHERVSSPPSLEWGLRPPSHPAESSPALLHPAPQARPPFQNAVTCPHARCTPCPSVCPALVLQNLPLTAQHPASLGCYQVTPYALGGTGMVSPQKEQHGNQEQGGRAAFEGPKAVVLVLSLEEGGGPRVPTIGSLNYFCVLCLSCT